MQNGAQKYNGGRSSLSGWFSTPQGSYVLDWEIAQRLEGLFTTMLTSDAELATRHFDITNVPAA